MHHVNPPFTSDALEKSEEAAPERGEAFPSKVVGKLVKELHTHHCVHHHEEYCAHHHA